MKGLLPQVVELQEKLKQFFVDSQNTVKNFPEKNSLLYSQNSEISPEHNSRFILDLISVENFKLPNKNIFFKIEYDRSTSLTTFKPDNQNLKWNESFSL